MIQDEAELKGSGEGQDIVFERKMMPMNKWGDNKRELIHYR
jgi:hypothetical protein